MNNRDRMINYTKWQAVNVHHYILISHSMDLWFRSEINGQAHAHTCLFASRLDKNLQKYQWRMVS